MPQLKLKRKKTNAKPTLHTKTARAERLLSFLQKFKPVPKEWKGAEGGAEAAPVLLPCNNYAELIASWQGAMQWTEGLDKALSVMLSAVTSTMTLGDQLWVKVIGPASCGKSTLCEAVSVNKNYVMAKSTFRGFHSGYGDGEQDHSLISQVSGKTLVTKDGDTLIQSPNLNQILSEARDLYDTVSRTSYRNKASKDYEGIRMTWILCGTASLKCMDSSELGERFLDCIIMDGIDDVMEDKILLEVAIRADKNMSIEATNKGDGQQDLSMQKAMQMTGGYVGFLRENCISLMENINFSHDALYKCTRYGKFVAYMRSRPSLQQDERAEREFAARLAIQHTRLAKCLAAVLNKTEVDSEVLERAKAVALDTSRGVVYDIAQALHTHDETGLENSQVAMMVGCTTKEIGPLMKFLSKILAVESFRKKVNSGVKGRMKWRLRPQVKTLFDEVHST